MSSNPMDREIARLLADGQAAARRGDSAMARTLLAELVDKEPHNEEAWMWLSAVVADPAEQQICLENALVINPYNTQARKGLEFLVAKSGATSRVPLVPPMPAPQPSFGQAMAAQANDSAGSAAPVYTVPTVPQEESTPGWAQHTPPAMPFNYAPNSQQDAPVAHSTPESWAMPTPDAAAPYAVPADVNVPNSSGFFTGDAKSEMTGTVPYTAAEPAPGDMLFPPAGSDGMAHGGGLNGNSHGNGNGNGSYHTSEKFQSGGEQTSPAFDFGRGAQPYAQPGIDSHALLQNQSQSGFVPLQGKLSAEDTATDLPAWLENLTPTVTTEHDDQGFPHFDMSNFGGTSSLGGMTNVGGMPGMPDPNMPFGAPTSPPQAMNAPSEMSNMGPFSDMRLPSPNELPGDDGRVSSGSGSSSAQPWYLQGSSGAAAPPMPTGGISSYLDSAMLNSSMLHGGMVGAAVLDDQRTKTGTTVECPNCKEHVPETSLACPNCRYNFFVNCPACHELVDTADATPGKVEPCPYCKASINKMELGMGGVVDLVSQKNPGSRPVAAVAVPFPTMEQDIPGLKRGRRGLSFNWVIDLLWLVAVILMVWALTQLPTWLNLSGMY